MCNFDVIKESVMLQGNLNLLLQSTDSNEIERHYNWLLWRAGRIRDYCKLKNSKFPADIPDDI